MSTRIDRHATQPDPARSTATPEPEHWWPRLIDHINDWWINRTDRQPATTALRDALRIPPIPATAAILTALIVLATVAGALAWWLLRLLLHLLTGIATATSHAADRAAHNGTGHVTSWALTRTITDPVHAYLTGHATGLLVTANTLWITWLVCTGGLFLLATIGVRGARIGWCLVGAVTTAMVYAATTPASAAPLAAGLTATVWAVLSIAAFNRITIPPADLSIVEFGMHRSHLRAPKPVGTDD